MVELWQGLKSQFITSFIVDDRWKLIVEGIGNTLIITFFALILGTVLGVIISAVRSSWDKTSPTMRAGLPKFLFSVINKICKLYLTVVRGTPMMIQLMIIYFIILTSTDKIVVAIIAFGINAGAYIAEIIRAGIMAVDAGQFEAGRSLGFNYIQSTWFIVLPQAFKNILPALANEFIVLLKETAIAGTIGITDLTRAAGMIRGVTFQSFVPLMTVALIYLSLVMFFTWIFGKLERRLRSSER